MTDATTLRDTLAATVQSALSDLPQKTAVVLACSGGRDSVALLNLVAHARPDLRVMVAHVDHGFTDQTAAVSVVSGHAAAHGMQWVSVPVDVHLDGHGVEAAARDARYSALFEVARTCGAACVLVAHTADDRAETVWMRIMRGSGPDGLYGFGLTDGDVRRPLVAVRRRDVHAYVDAYRLGVYDDPMNADRSFLRVAVRDELAPLFDRLGDDVVAATCRLADLAGEDRRLFADMVAETVPFTLFGDVAVLVECDVFDRAPLPVKRRAVRRMLEHVTKGPGRTPRQPSYQDVARIVQADTPTRFSVHGDVDVIRDDRFVTVLHARHVQGEQAVTDRPVDVPLFGCRLKAGRVDGVPVHTPPALFGDGTRFRVCGKDASALTLRAVKPGDTVHTRGRDVPVKDLLAGSSMPVVLRRAWPVLCRAQQVVWVPGFAADDSWLCSAGDTAAVEVVFVKGDGGDE